jgi:hypothetical protein
VGVRGRCWLLARVAGGAIQKRQLATGGTRTCTGIEDERQYRGRALEDGRGIENERAGVDGSAGEPHEVGRGRMEAAAAGRGGREPGRAAAAARRGEERNLAL